VIERSQSTPSDSEPWQPSSHQETTPYVDGPPSLVSPMYGSANEYEGRRSSSFGQFGRELIQIALPAVLLALVIHIFLAQATVVYGQSMQPNLHPAERLVIEKVSYYFHSPDRYDIVVIDLPHMSDLLIKRVIGLPGETIEIRDGVILVDGIAQKESYAPISGDTQLSPITLRPMTYFVMGDNRVNSNDSRAFGPVSRSAIIGRAWLRYWPLNQFHIFGQ
jgi:signal peptidase I